MKNQTVILLIIAGACGLVAMMGVKQYLAKQNNKEEVPKVKVLVASAPIKQGVPLTELNTQFTTVDAATCPPGVVTDLEMIKERALKVSRGIGDWIMVDQLTEKGQTGATAVIPPGMRVTTIPVDATTHHSGMLQPGNRIDLLLSYRDRDQATGEQVQKIMPLLEYIEVFAVDNVVYGVTTAGENTQARNISLLVTPDQMMRLQLAKKKGDISTVLRSSEDMDAMTITEMSEDSLSSAAGTPIDDTSTLDVSENAAAGFALPDTDMMSLLGAELENDEPGGTGPVLVADATAGAEDDQFWTMAIYESGGVRVEKVNLLSDEPIDTRGAGGRPAAGRPAGDPRPGGGDVPSVPGLDDLDLDQGDSGALEEAASSLLELFE